MLKSLSLSLSLWQVARSFQVFNKQPLHRPSANPSKYALPWIPLELPLIKNNENINKKLGRLNLISHMMLDLSQEDFPLKPKNLTFDTSKVHP